MIQVTSETEALALRAAQKTGITAAQFVDEAVRERARCIGVGIAPAQKRTVEEMIAGLSAIADRVKTLPLYDTRTPQEIMDEINEIP